MSIESHLVSIRTYLEGIEGTQQEILRELRRANLAQTEPSASDGREPMPDYDSLTVQEVLDSLENSNEAARERVLLYERANKKRKGVIEALEHWGA